MHSFAIWTSCQILNTGRASAVENMRWDAERLASLSPDDPPILHLYSWEGDCATYGHFVKPEQFFDMDAVGRANLSLARRPTGGGIIFHTGDLAFSILIPSGHPAYSTNTLVNYAFVNNIVSEAIQASIGIDEQAMLLPAEEPCLGKAVCRFCMAKPTKYDVMVGGKKVGGAAQRRVKQGFLHQGSISLVPPSASYLKEVLLDGANIAAAMAENSYYLFPEGLDASELDQARHRVQEALVNAAITHIE